MITLITQLARYEMVKGKEIEATGAFQKMAAAVKANEPGCLMYAVTRGQVNAQELYIYEVYENQAAFDAHRKTDHMQAFRKSTEALLDRGSFNVEILDEVAGYIRAPVEEMRGQM
jgi:quinol monooxygenase YgiN